MNFFVRASLLLTSSMDQVELVYNGLSDSYET
jgi:hypothetical protein